MKRCALTVPIGAAAVVVAEVAGFGSVNKETGGFLLAENGRTEISLVAVAGETGVLRARDLFQITSTALDRLFRFAEEHDVWIPVQFHSHRRHAFLSNADARHGFCVEGFVSAVVPTYDQPPKAASDWGWWCFHDAAWQTMEAPAASTVGVAVLRFDENEVVRD